MRRLTPAERQLRMIPESAWQAQILELARRTGWRVAHHHDSRRQAGGQLVGDRDAAGLPDLILVRPPRVLFVELKRETGRASDTQQAWLNDLQACPGVETYLWRPRDLEHAAQVLTRQPH